MQIVILMSTVRGKMICNSSFTDSAHTCTALSRLDLELEPFVNCFAAYFLIVLVFRSTEPARFPHSLLGSMVTWQAQHTCDVVLVSSYMSSSYTVHCTLYTVLYTVHCFTVLLNEIQPSHSGTRRALCSPVGL